jgi:chlorite dismutase
MSFTVADFHDLIRLVETRPEWRAELRRLVLTDELLTVPDQLAALRARSEEQFQALAEAQQRTDLQLTTLTERVTALTAAQERMDSQLTTLTESVPQPLRHQGATRSPCATVCIARVMSTQSTPYTMRATRRR